MTRLLFTVEDTFQIKGRGLILTPGISINSDDRIKVSDPIRLKRTDGSTMLWEIHGFEMFGKPRHDIAILLRDLRKEDVPIGTEVWSVDEMPIYPAEQVLAEMEEIIRDLENRNKP